MSRPKRTADELRKASDHLFYEARMLAHAATVLGSGALTDSPLGNSVLESFTVHARCLLAFLWSVSPRDDDVVAEDFVDAAEWSRLRAEKSAALDHVHQRTSKEVVHLTYSRQEILPELKRWNHPAISKELLSVLDVFLANVPVDLLGPRWGRPTATPIAVPWLGPIVVGNYTTTL